MQKTFKTATIENETLRLFNALVVGDHVSPRYTIGNKLAEASIKNGYIFSPVLLGYYTDDQLMAYVTEVNKVLGVSDAQLNASLHKSWAKVRDASDAQLLIEQLVHYVTTYGFETMGLYNEDRVYFPDEVLDLPEGTTTDKIKLTVVKGYTTTQLKEKLMDLLGSGIALKSETVEDIVTVAKFVGFSNEDLPAVKNREAMVALCDYLDLAPEAPAEFLRLLIYKATGRTMVIKDRDTIEAIQNIGPEAYKGTINLFNLYKKRFGLHKMAAIFFRYKALFLAFRKGCSELKRDINAVRRLANKYHKPTQPDYLSTITGAIKHGHKPEANVFLDKLSKVNLARKIRLAQALNYRIYGGSSILYRIRNGKGYATDIENVGSKLTLEQTLNLTMSAIADEIKPNVEGKNILMPGYIDYALPATEKQFSGNFPTGTCVTIRDGYGVFGVHWENVGDHRVDLDLSCTDISGKKFGWDGSYRSSSRGLMFSGDVTDAPKRRGGASELFAISADAGNTSSFYQLNVNYYNFRQDVPVPFGVVVGHRNNCKSMEKNNMLTSDELLSRSKTLMDVRQKTLGLIWVGPEGCKFYYTEVMLGGGITSRFPEAQQKALQYMVDYHTNVISVRKVLVSAGANLIDPLAEVEEEVEIDIDLTPENLERDTILKLIM